jgi:hypothetical protein
MIGTRNVNIMKSIYRRRGNHPLIPDLDCNNSLATIPDMPGATIWPDKVMRGLVSGPLYQATIDERKTEVLSRQPQNVFHVTVVAIHWNQLRDLLSKFLHHPPIESVDYEI